MTNPEAVFRMARDQFLAEVEEIVKTDGSYIDAIQTVCERNEIEIESSPFYVTGALKERVTLEARQKFLLKHELCQNDIVELPL